MRSPPSKIPALSNSISQLIPRIIQGAHIGFLAKRQLTHTQLFVLVAIHSQGQPSMRTLSNNLKVSMPTMSGVIERLVKAGYAIRSKHPRDRRQVLVELTPRGERMVAEFQRMISERWQEVLKALDSPKIKVFGQIVEELKKSLEKDSHREKA